MKIRNVGETAALTLIAAPTLGGGHAMLALSPAIAWTFIALGALSLAMAVEFACGAPLLTRFADWTWERRRRRIEAEAAAAEASRRAAFEAGIARHRATVKS